jgi:hypothetical protein
MKQRRSIARSILLALALAMITGCLDSSSSAPNTVSERSPRMVGMWVLMLWFNDPTINYYPWVQYTRFVPEFGQYNSYDFDWIYYTLRNAEELGVDYLVLDDTNGVFREGAFDLTIEHYLTAIRQTHSKIKIAIATGYEIWYDRDWQLFLSSIKHLEKYFSDPAYYNVDGKPLMVLYLNPDDQLCSMISLASAAISASECATQYMSESDPMGYRSYFSELSLRYASGADSWFFDELGLYGWQFDYPQVVNANSMGVMPGWNRSHKTLIGTTPPIDRDGGNYYSQSWEYVLNHPPQNLVITSWDDWAEETAIAPATVWGNSYVDRTRQYISRYKAL